MIAPDLPCYRLPALFAALALAFAVQPGVIRAQDAPLSIAAPPPSSDAVTAALADSRDARFAPAIDAVLAEAVLAGVGLATEAPAQVVAKARAAKTSANPFRTAAPGALPSDAPQLSLADFASRRFGDTDGLAFELTDSVPGASAIATDARLRHASGPLDLVVNLAGNKPLRGAQPMAFAYDTRVTYTVGPALKLGMAASGDLGTLGALTPAPNQIAGPFANLALQHGDLSLGADAGYSFRLVSEPNGGLDRFHARVNLKLKL
jgi:hypothetical protein